MSFADWAGRRSAILWVGAVIVILDQATKAVMLANMPLHARVPVIDGLFAWTHVHNRGMAFGLFNAVGSPYLRWVLAGVAILAVGIIWSYARQEVPRPTVMLAFGGILGGAIGNLLDRVRYGYVEDFILVHWRASEFPAFNVADAAITMGGLVMFITLARERDEPEAPPEEPDTSGPAAETPRDA